MKSKRDLFGTISCQTQMRSPKKGYAMIGEAEDYGKHPELRVRGQQARYALKRVKFGGQNKGARPFSKELTKQRRNKAVEGSGHPRGRWRFGPGTAHTGGHGGKKGERGQPNHRARPGTRAVHLREKDWHKACFFLVGGGRMHRGSAHETQAVQRPRLGRNLGQESGSQAGSNWGPPPVGTY